MHEIAATINLRFISFFIPFPERSHPPEKVETQINDAGKPFKLDEAKDALNGIGIQGMTVIEAKRFRETEGPC